jgi:NAD(P)-dependent dehydrogenase (short-subunit alcohol dehydrogenase family)
MILTRERKMIRKAQDDFKVKGLSIVITGGAGVLCSRMVKRFVELGAHVAVLDLDFKSAKGLVNDVEGNLGTAVAIQVDVLDKKSIQTAAKQVINIYRRIDVLINGAGGNNSKATTGEENSFFDLPVDAIRFVTDLNFLGTILPTQVFGKHIAEQGEGVILNVSSMNALRPLTRIPAYSAAKAAVSNFTQWLAVHMAKEYSPNIRVNAIAPGFLLTDQNRFLLTDETSGELTDRGKSILDHTPMNRFGDPEDLLGVVQWLISPASKFVTGTVIPIDGGFSAFSGV